MGLFSNALGVGQLVSTWHFGKLCFGSNNHSLITLSTVYFESLWQSANETNKRLSSNINYRAKRNNAGSANRSGNSRLRMLL